MVVASGVACTTTIGLLLCVVADPWVRFASVGFGSARFGSVRLGSARLGSARLGSARLGSAGFGSWLQFKDGVRALADACEGDEGGDGVRALLWYWRACEETW